jgi:hypothetical protein
MTAETRVERAERATRESRSTSEKKSSTSASTSTHTKREIYYAPETALEIVEPYIKDFKAIWDPACGPSENYPLRDYFEKQGHRVVFSDVLMGKDYDFFTYKTKKRYDIMVTTPPYSLRKEFILRALELKKPFAFLVPMNVLESQSLRDAFKQYNVSVIYPEKSVSFVSPEDSRSVKSLPYSVWVVGGVPKMPPVIYL